jgi:hypothetical protein
VQVGTETYNGQPLPSETTGLGIEYLFDENRSANASDTLR